MSPKFQAVRHGLAPSAVLAGLAAFAGACGPSGPAPAPGEPPLVERLATPTPFQVDLGGSTAAVVARAEGEVEPTEFDLDILGGSAVARVTGAEELVVESFSVDIDSVTIPAELVPPDGLPLRDIRVTIERPGGAPLDDLGDMIATVVELDVLVEWSGEFEDGRLYPLRSMRLENLPVSVEIQEAEGGLRAHLTAVRQGPFWEWGGMFELSDLTVDLGLQGP